MDLDDILDVDDFAVTTIANLIERLARSAGETQCVYRESELDEVWRLVDIEISRGEAREIGLLVALRDAIRDAHDLVGIDNAPAAAAQRLRAGLDVWQRSGSA